MSDCSSEHVVRFEKYNVGNGITVYAVAKLSLTHRIPSCGAKGNDCMFKGYSLRKSAKIVGITWVMFFIEKHKLLNALKQIDFEHFDGIVEIDEIYFLYSQKGQRCITERKPRKGACRRCLESLDTDNSLRLSKFVVSFLFNGTEESTSEWEKDESV